MNYRDKKWAIILHSGAAAETPPPENAPWTDHAFRNVSRILQAPIYPVKSQNIPDKYDIYLFCSIWIGDMATEIAWSNDIRRRGRKVVLTFSHDSRFVSGHALIDEHGNMYTDLVAASDVTLSGLPESVNMFGRYKDKVISSGGFLERVNLSVPYKKRNIDLLVSGMRNEDHFGLSAEILLSLIRTFPGRNIVYCARSKAPCAMNTFFKKHKEVSFVYDKLTSVLPMAKVHLNIDWRPSPGRSVMESWYYRVPTIGYELSYYSKLFPGLSYQHLCIDQILSRCETALKEDHNTLIAKAEGVASTEYYDVLCNKIMHRLYG